MNKKGKSILNYCSALPLAVFMLHVSFFGELPTRIEGRVKTMRWMSLSLADSPIMMWIIKEWRAGLLILLSYHYRCFLLYYPFRHWNSTQFLNHRDATSENSVYRRLLSTMPSAVAQRTSSISSVRLVVAIVRSNSALISFTILLLVAQIINGQQNTQQQTCPAANEVSPCVCQVKKNGLDILCEATDYVHITRAMTALKPKSPIIFYLKLRHNSLPKLQGFIFLALDIRHLTIHNSSLAVIEETSLSSLGELNTLCSPFSYRPLKKGSTDELLSRGREKFKETKEIFNETKEETRGWDCVE